MAADLGYNPTFYPILMSTPMARATLAKEKVETRRVIKNPGFSDEVWQQGTPHNGADAIMREGPYLRVAYDEETDRCGDRVECPYGVAGGRLWVRETWQLQYSAPWLGGGKVGPHTEVKVGYKASYRNKRESVRRTLFDPKQREQADRAMKHGSSFRPGIHMSRWACRMILELTSVRVERVQDINIVGVQREGLKHCTKDGELFKWGWEGLPWTDWYMGKATEAFEALWDQINAARGYSWESNPFVWVLGFTLLEEK